MNMRRPVLQAALIAAIEHHDRKLVRMLDDYIRFELNLCGDAQSELVQSLVGDALLARFVLYTSGILY